MSAEQTPGIEAAIASALARYSYGETEWACLDVEGRWAIAEPYLPWARKLEPMFAPVLAAAVREARRSWEAHVLERCLETMPAKGEAPDFLLTISTAMLATRADRVAEPQHEAATSGKESEASDE